MILVDTSVWIDHLRTGETRLIGLLRDDEVGCHHLVVQELSLGSIKERDVVLEMLSNLYHFPTVGHPEILHLVERRRLWGRGVGAVDVNLLGAVAVVAGARLWTRDNRLKTVCTEVGVPIFDEG